MLVCTIMRNVCLRQNSYYWKRIGKATYLIQPRIKVCIQQTPASVNSTYNSFYTAHKPWRNAEDVGTGPKHALSSIDRCVNSAWRKWCQKHDIYLWHFDGNRTYPNVFICYREFHRKYCMRMLLNQCMYHLLITKCV